MNTAVRDLEQIEERDPTEHEAHFRRAAAFVLAAIVTLGLVYGMAAVLSDPEPENVVDHDPLAALSQSEALAVEADAIGEEDLDSLEVDRSALTFPTTLVGDDRPEVAAALAAATAEHESLGAHEPAGFAPVVLPPPSLPAIPAAVAATGGIEPLVEASRRDPLVAESMPEPEPVERGTVGHEGEYILQVVSYRTEDEADSFARALRDKGHDTYVEEADVEDRGRFYRVRIGPFETRGEALRYRRRFEQAEEMDTFVVRRQRDPEEE